MAGNREQRLRYKAKKAARDQEIIDGLKSLGFCCGLCQSYTGPVGMNAKGRCELNTDFYGVCTVPAADICIWFRLKNEGGKRV